MASVGLFLLGHMALPAAKDLTLVKGDVEQVGMISRKGLGSFYDLTVRTPDGEQSRVLIHREVAPEEMMRSLIGHSIAAEVNWSSEAVRLETDGAAGNIAENVQASAIGAQRTYDIIGALALALGIFLGFAYLILNGRRPTHQ